MRHNAGHPLGLGLIFLTAPNYEPRARGPLGNGSGKAVEPRGVS